MKYTIIILLLLCYGVGNGQLIAPAGTLGGTIRLDSSYTWQEKAVEYDTLICLALISDTSQPYTVLESISSRNHKFYTTIDTFWSEINYGARWVYLYDVREMGPGDGDTAGNYWMCEACIPTHKYYLDDKKRRLKKSIIVWQSIPIKK